MKIELKSFQCDKSELITLPENEVANYTNHQICPTCQYSKNPPQILARLGGNNWRSKLEIGICMCCDTIYYVNPPNSEQINHYYKYEWDKRTVDVNMNSKLDRLPINPKIKQICEDLGIQDKNIRILDVGCGLGGMMAGLAQVGFTNVYGLEQSSYRSKTARLRFSGQVYSEGYREHVPTSKYDLIYCNHVLEHIYQPSDYFNWLRENLSPSGLAIVCVPNAQWEQVINQLFFLPHLHSLTAKALSLLAENIGFSSKFWMKSHREDEICVVCYRTDSTIAKHLTDRFVNLDCYPDISLSKQIDRFRSIWDRGHDPSNQSVLVNWPNSNHLQSIKDPVQRWNSYTIWPSFSQIFFRLLLFRRQLALRFWFRINLGEGIINRLLSAKSRQLTDYNFLVFQTTGNSEDGIPEISLNTKAPVLIK